MLAIPAFRRVVELGEDPLLLPRLLIPPLRASRMNGSAIFSSRLFRAQPIHIIHSVAIAPAASASTTGKTPESPRKRIFTPGQTRRKRSTSSLRIARLCWAASIFEGLQVGDQKLLAAKT